MSIFKTSIIAIVSTAAALNLNAAAISETIRSLDSIQIEDATSLIQRKNNADVAYETFEALSAQRHARPGGYIERKAMGEFHGRGGGNKVKSPYDLMAFAQSAYEREILRVLGFHVVIHLCGPKPLWKLDEMQIGNCTRLKRGISAILAKFPALAAK